MMIRDSLVLVESTSLKWRWRLINSILKSKDSMLRKVEDYTLNRLVTMCMSYYKYLYSPWSVSKVNKSSRYRNVICSYN